MHNILLFLILRSFAYHFCKHSQSFFKFHFTNLRHDSWIIIKQRVLLISNNKSELQFQKSSKDIHSHKKLKDSLEGCLDWVLFAADFEFPKILVPRLFQNSSNVNTECAGKSKQLYSLCDQLLGALIYIYLLFSY